MRLDVSSVLLQWATGGLVGCWMTTRHRAVGVGYGWLLRGIYGSLALGGALAGIASGGTDLGSAVRDSAGLAAAALALFAIGVSVVWRQAGPAGFDPRLDLLAPLAGLAALTGAAGALGGPYPLTLARLVIGGLLLGLVTDAMLLGHWYLVQPGLAREPIREVVRLSAMIWPFDVAVLLVPTGMISVLNGTIDDGYHGLLAVIWAVSSVTTIALLAVTWLALKERSYSAVMAATGLLYLAILTAFGTDLLARALLAS